jgi:hypothetical protein
MNRRIIGVSFVSEGRNNGRYCEGEWLGEVREGLDGATAERMKLVILGSRKERDEEVDEA